MMKLLFRVFAFSTDNALLVKETLVFFESDRLVVETRLETLLSQVWSVPTASLGGYNICCEAELHHRACNKAPYHSPEWDLQLLEVGGADNVPCYPTECPLLLVLPPNHQRLMRAFVLAQEHVSRVTTRLDACSDSASPQRQGGVSHG